jgi:hypothetical protein
MGERGRIERDETPARHAAARRRDTGFAPLTRGERVEFIELDELP